MNSSALLNQHYYLVIAKFIVEIRGYTVDEDDMLCLKLKVDFMRPFSRFW